MANFRRFIHKWREFEVSLNDLDTIVPVKEMEDKNEEDDEENGKAKFWEKDKETQKAYRASKYFVRYWYYDNDNVYTVDEPQDVRMGHWVEKEIDIMVQEDPNDPTSEMIPSGNQFYGKIQNGTGQ